MEIWMVYIILQPVEGKCHGNSLTFSILQHTFFIKNLIVFLKIDLCESLISPTESGQM